MNVSHTRHAIARMPVQMPPISVPIAYRWFAVRRLRYIPGLINDLLQNCMALEWKVEGLWRECKSTRIDYLDALALWVQYHGSGSIANGCQKSGGSHERETCSQQGYSAMVF